MELSYIYPVIFFVLLASIYRQSSASVRFDADGLVPACSCRPRIVRINDSIYVPCCFFSPLRLDVDFPHGFRRLRFSLFYHPVFNQLQTSTSFLPPSMLSHELILPASTGLGNSSAVGHDMVGQLATAFLDALYKA